MNSRVCKRLRGLARARSVGLPAREISAQTITFKGKKVARMVNTPATTRGIYRALKKQERARP